MSISRFIHVEAEAKDMDLISPKIGFGPNPFCFAFNVFYCFARSESVLIDLYP